MDKHKERLEREEVGGMIVGARNIRKQALVGAREHRWKNWPRKGTIGRSEIAVKVQFGWTD